MKQLKPILKKIFCLPPLPTVLIAAPSFVLVFAVLSLGAEGPLAYAAYILSAYAMIITITGAPRVSAAVRDALPRLAPVKKLRSTRLGDRLLGDAVFRTELTLHGGLAANLLYVGLNLYSGFRYRSAWFLSLAIYYALLSAMRALLVRYVHRKPVGEDICAELSRYRTCGIILLFMDQALVCIVIYMVTQERGFSYAGNLVYAMALYTFYLTIVSIVNVIKYRRRGSPLLSAAKVVSLTAALVSMLSLETAMIAQFGNDPVFRRRMLAGSGGAVCTIVLAMAVYMIVQATKQQKQLRTDAQPTE